MGDRAGRLQTEGPRRRLHFASDDRLVALVRGGDARAFEVFYERHAGALLRFCAYMLGSLNDAEEAVQVTFVSAHRALLADDRAISARPWLFAIARNACLSIMRQRKHTEQATEEAPDVHDDPLTQLEQREELRRVLQGVIALPERQREALVLSEFHGLSHAEIGQVMDVRVEQVKSYVFQARSNLISERTAHSADCGEIREELASVRGPGLLKAHLRRHLRSCSGCREYEEALTRQRRQLGALLPLLPSVELGRRVLLGVLGNPVSTGSCTTVSGSAATGSAELMGGSVKAVLVKVLAGAVCLGAGVGSGVSLLGASPHGAAAGSHSEHLSSAGSVRLVASLRMDPAAGQRRSVPTSRTTGRRGLNLAHPDAGSRQLAPPASTASADPMSTAADGAAPDARTASSGGPMQAAAGETGKGSHGGGRSAEAPAQSRTESPGRSSEIHGASSHEQHGKSQEAHGKAEEPHGTSQEAHGKAEEPPGKSEEPHGPAVGSEAAVRSEEAQPSGHSAEAAQGKSEALTVGGASEQAHGKSEEAHTKKG